MKRTLEESRCEAQDKQPLLPRWMEALGKEKPWRETVIWCSGTSNPLHDREVIMVPPLAPFYPGYTRGPSLLCPIIFTDSAYLDLTSHCPRDSLSPPRCKVLFLSGPYITPASTYSSVRQASSFVVYSSLESTPTVLELILCQDKKEENSFYPIKLFFFHSILDVSCTIRSYYQRSLLFLLYISN